MGLLKSDCPYPDDENELYEAKVLILSLDAAAKPVEDGEIQKEDKTGTTLAKTCLQTCKSEKLLVKSWAFVAASGAVKETHESRMVMEEVGSSGSGCHH